MYSAADAGSIDRVHHVRETPDASPNGRSPQMPRIVITHAVQDVDRWLRGKDERAASLPGATNVTDLVALDGSKQAGVAFDIDDVDTLTAMLSSMPPDVAAKAESHGVVMPLAVFVEA